MALSEFERAKVLISVGEAFQKKHFLDDFIENVGLYQGNPVNAPYDSVRPFKTHTVFPIVDSNVSSLYAQNPHVVCTPRQERYTIKSGRQTSEVLGVRAAKLIEDICSYVTREQGLKIQFQDAIRDAELGGYGGVELGWLSRIERLPIPQDTSATGQTEISIEYKDYLRDASSYTVRRDPRQFLFPPWAQNMREMPYVTYWEFCEADEVIAEPMFDPKMRKQLADKIRSHGGQAYASEGEKPLYGAVDMRTVNRDSNFCMVKLYHIWSLKERKYKVYCDQVDDFLRNDDWPFKKMEGYPFEFLFYFPSYTTLYPQRPVDIYKTKAIEMERLRVRMLDAIDKSVAKILTTEKDPKIREAFARSPQGGMTTVKSTSENYIREIVVSHMPPEWVAFYQMMQGDVIVEAQTMETRVGSQSGGSVKATELIQRNEAFQIKKARKQAMIEEWLKNIYKKIIQLWQENMTEKMSLKISPQNGGLDFISFSKEQIQGEYDFEIDIETAAPSTPARQIQLTRDLLELSAVMPQIFDQRKLAAKLVKNLKENPDDTLVRPVNIDAVKLAEMEWMQMQQGQPVMPSEGEDHNAHIDAHLQQMLQVQQGANSGQPITPEIAAAAQMLVAHIAATEQMMQPTGQVLPSHEGTDGNRTMQSERSAVSTPVGQALSATTEATRNAAEMTPQ